MPSFRIGQCESVRVNAWERERGRIGKGSERPESNLCTSVMIRRPHWGTMPHQAVHSPILHAILPVEHCNRTNTAAASRFKRQRIAAVQQERCERQQRIEYDIKSRMQAYQHSHWLWRLSLNCIIANLHNIHWSSTTNCRSRRPASLLSLMSRTPQ